MPDFHTFMRDPRTPGRLAAMVADNARVDRALAEQQRPCPVCPKAAWLESDGPDGLRFFMCPEGHRLIVAPAGQACE